MSANKESELLKMSLKRSEGRKVIGGLMKIKEKLSDLEQRVRNEHVGDRRESQCSNLDLAVETCENGDKSDNKFERIESRLLAIENELKFVVDSLTRSASRQTVTTDRGSSLDSDDRSLRNVTTAAATRKVVKCKIYDEDLKDYLIFNHFEHILDDLREEHRFLKEEIDIKRKLLAKRSQETTRDEILFLENRLKLKEEQMAKVINAKSIFELNKNRYLNRMKNASLNVLRQETMRAACKEKPLKWVRFKK